MLNVFKDKRLKSVRTFLFLFSAFRTHAPEKLFDFAFIVRFKRFENGSAYLRTKLTTQSASSSVAPNC